MTAATTADILAQLRTLGVQLSADGDRLRVSAPKGALTPELQADLSTRKAEILAFLRQAQAASARAAAIPPADRSRPLALSIGQERILALAYLKPQSWLYNLYLVLRIDGPLDAPCLEAALRAVIARHETLRTGFRSVRGAATAAVAPAVEWSLPVVDLRGAPDAPERARHLIEATVRQPFDLGVPPLLRACLVRDAEASATLTLVMHNSISDGWSWAVLLRELGALYDAGRAGGDAALPPLPIQYADYAAWQRRELEGEAAEAQRAYWAGRLAGLSDALALPPDRPRPAAERNHAARTRLVIPPALAAQARELAQRGGVTLFQALLALFAATLHAASGAEDIAVCTPVACRGRSELQGLIGYLNNMVMLRADLSGRPSYRQLIGRAQALAREAFANQDLPFDQVAALPGLANRRLAHLMFVVQDRANKTLELSGARVTQEPVYDVLTSYDCSLYVEDHGAELECIAVYKSELYEEATVQGLLQRFAETIARAAADPDAPIAQGAPAPQRQAPIAQGAPAAPRAFVAPRTPLEGELAGIWARMLGRERVGVRDSFFELGGHSLLALRLVTRVEEELGVNLPLSALLEDPTVEHFARLIEGGRHLEPWSPLVAIQPLGSRPPFFGVHGIHGNILFWRDIVEQLGPDQPFYGLQSRGVDGFQPALDSIEAMARLYVAEIRAVQPHGPYHLGGYSLGGEVAFEMAQQLHAAGEQVALLAMFDTINPDRPLRRAVLAQAAAPAGGEQRGDEQRGLALRLAVWRRKIAGHVGRMARLGIAGQARYLWGDARMRARRTYHRARVAWYRRRVLRLPVDLLLAHLEQRHTVALMSYLPQPYPGRITLFRSRESLAHSPLGDPLGWEPLAGAGVEVHLLDSPHRMVAAEYVGELAVLLQDCIDRASRR